MKGIALVFLPLLAICIFILGCSPSFWGGAAGGAVGTGAGYEYNASQEAKRVEEEYKAGRMSETEYNARKDQIEKMSVTR